MYQDWEWKEGIHKISSCRLYFLRLWVDSAPSDSGEHELYRYQRITLLERTAQKHWQTKGTSASWVSGVGGGFRCLAVWISHCPLQSLVRKQVWLPESIQEKVSTCNIFSSAWHLKSQLIVVRLTSQKKEMAFPPPLWPHNGFVKNMKTQSNQSFLCWWWRTP